MAVFKTSMVDSTGLIGIAADGLVAVKLVHMNPTLPLYPGEN